VRLNWFWFAATLVCASSGIYNAVSDRWGLAVFFAIVSLIAGWRSFFKQGDSLTSLTSALYQMAAIAATLTVGFIAAVVAAVDSDGGEAVGVAVFLGFFAGLSIAAVVFVYRLRRRVGGADRRSPKSDEAVGT
jgi:hypothetical protein